MIKTLNLVSRIEPDEVFWEVIVDTDYDEDSLQKEVDKIIEQFERKGFSDWTFEDILKELTRKGILKVIKSDTLTIWT